jgi:hypothetical protein
MLFSSVIAAGTQIPKFDWQGGHLSTRSSFGPMSHLSPSQATSQIQAPVSSIIPCPVHQALQLRKKYHGSHRHSPKSLQSPAPEQVSARLQKMPHMPELFLYWFTVHSSQSVPVWFARHVQFPNPFWPSSQNAVLLFTHVQLCSQCKP